MARLVVNPGSPSAWEIQLKPGPNYIGRGFANDFKIPDPSVSGSHCEILVDNLAVVIKDLGSTNGTFVNRASVREAPLQPGQTIHLGGVEMLFVADAPEGVGVPPPPLAAAAAPLASPGGRPLPVARPVSQRPIAVATPTVTAPPLPTVARNAPPVSAAVSLGRPAASRVPTEATGPAVAAPPPPPMPPPVAPPIPTLAPGKCNHHPRTLGRFFCHQCKQYFCELCVNSHNVGRESHKFCRICGNQCEPVQVPASQPTVQKAGFFTMAMGAFAYPLKGDGIILLATGTFFFSILDAAKFFAGFAGLLGLAAMLILFVLGTGYLTCYLRRIVTSSAMGETVMPDWPDVSDLSSDVVGPFFQLVGTTLVCFLPAIVASIFVVQGHPEFAWLIIATVVLGCLYYPMAFLAMSMLDSVMAVNPLVVVPAIFKVPAGYVFLIVLFGSAFAVTWIGNALLGLFIPLRMVSAIISRLIGLYLLMVEMRALGLLYFAYRERFGWLNR